MFNESSPQPPYVTRLDKAVPCEGTVYKRYSFRGAGSDDPAVRQAHADRTACKNSARWRHEGMASKDDYSQAGPTGNFCWSHLVHHAMGSMEDVERYETWLKGGKS